MISDNDIKKLKSVFATKNDLKNFATKDDLKNFATKDDLKNFATKDDLKNFATKSELNDGLRKLENKIELSNEKWHSKIFNLVDGLAKEIHDSRESRVIFSYRIEDLDKRVKVLEE